MLMTPRGAVRLTKATSGSDTAHFQQAKHDGLFVALLDQVVGFEQQDLWQANLSTPVQEFLCICMTCMSAMRTPNGPAA
jgi:hypothetical protein